MQNRTAWAVLAAVAACEAGPADTTVQGQKNAVDGQLGTAVDAADAVEPVDAAPVADSVVDAPAVVDVPPPYRGPQCIKHAICQKEAPTTPFCDTATQQCVRCLIDVHCAAGDVCADHTCKPLACEPGANSCEGPFLRVCNPDGKSFTTQECGAGLQCVNGACLLCDPGKVYCASPSPGASVSKELLQCSADGKTATQKQACAAGTWCVGGKCQACQPGLKTCVDDTAMVCKDDGSGFEVFFDCGQKGWQCYGGQCINPCDGEGATKSKPPSCDAWAVDLHNAASAQDAPFAVTVANRNPLAALVKVTAGTGQSEVYGVPAGSLKILVLPDAAWKAGPFNQSGSGVNKAAYHLEYDRELEATQLNPLQGAGTGSGGATALLKASTLGSTHHVVTRAQSDAGLNGYVTVVATQAGKTQVQIEPTAPTEAAGMGEKVPMLWPGGKLTLDLAQGEVLTLESATQGADLTGTRIKTDQKVAVFAGSQGARVPNAEACVNGKCAGAGWACTSSADCPKVCCADHLEAQLPPTNAWGTAYVAGRFQPRGQAKDVWRVMADTDNTKIKTDPPQTPVPTLQKGQWFEFEASEDFALSANHPVLLVQFMAGMGAPAGGFDTCDGKRAGQTVCKQHWQQLGVAVGCQTHGDCPQLPQPGQAGTGGPEMVVVPPVGVWGASARFLCPAGYAAQFATLVASPGAQVQLDGKVVASGLFAPAGKLPNSEAGAIVARVPLSAGQHQIESNKPFHATVHGWSPGTSYAYTTGSTW